jgi:gamma-glutamyl hydrolase
MNPVIFASLLLGSALATERPIVGIMSQAIHSELDAILPPGHNFTTYIAASYIKWVEAAGARAVPVLVGNQITSEQYFETVFSGVNGLLIPGGAVSLYDSDYAAASNWFFARAKQENDAGEVFPIWGTCLGFEMLALMANDGQPNLARCLAVDQPLPLDLLPGWEESKLLAPAAGEVLEQLSSLPVTLNSHHWCLTMENFTKFEMEKFWRPLSTNIDQEGLEFLSAMESRDYPIYGTQFHPEKNAYEWAPKLPGIPHSREAVNVAQYFAEFFIDTARQSSHSFQSRSEEESHLIYNYQPVYTGAQMDNWAFQQAYVF